jgi:hypothetical protein
MRHCRGFARLRTKAREWGRRYLPAECVGILCTILGGVGTSMAFGNPLLTALGGTLGEDIGYYGTMLANEIRAERTGAGASTAAVMLRAVRNIALEFSGAELLDSVLVRPAALYALTAYSGNLALGLILGKLTADIAFYIPAIIAYELRKKYLVERMHEPPPMLPEHSP